MTFVLHPRLSQDCFELGSLTLCRLLLMNDNQYPWFVLVPQHEGVREIYELSESDQFQLMRESSLLSRAMVKLFSPDKLNIAALGNIVPQLHVHHIARFATDPAWPAPVWGKLPSQPYTEPRRRTVTEALRGELAQSLEWVKG